MSLRAGLKKFSGLYLHFCQPPFLCTLRIALLSYHYYAAVLYCTGLSKINSPHVKEARGVGLLCGLQLDMPAGPVVAAAREMGVLAITAGAGDVVRLVPPLVVTEAEIDKCVEVLGKAIAQLK
jgi:acetylornithine/succinyldiaminopimelate/putrescine aminotransferase